MTRIDRVSALLRKEISQILLEDVNDPRIDFVSITNIEITPDLINAKVFVSIFGDERKKQEAMDGLTSATSFIRTKLSQLIKARSAPQILFVRDDSLDRGSRVLGLMSKINQENEKPKNT